MEPGQGARSRRGGPSAPRRRTARTFRCEQCGLVIGRDENAALNLASLVKRHVAGSGPETLNGRGADCKTGPGPAGGCEASASHRPSTPGQTRTFAQK
ncbi:zinc ribbon domain-containing protein [Kitasatospora sp. NPDC056531]|uniref:zinc ribbon domain-containing protein n=1 Tax=Kitasatospora sp. NPDC056531 TaxID=3345856 RepID=UPI0036CADA82